MNDGGPAFPIQDENGGGMSLRDWFAGMALLGILARGDKESIEAVAIAFNLSGGQAVCKVAYDSAEHMLEHREKTK